MADPHLWMLVVPFAANIWWTKHWLLSPVFSRWRFAVAGLVGAILWIYCAYISTRVIVPEGGTDHVFGSIGLAYFSAFMAFISVVGVLLGLLLWTEEEGQRVAAGLPDAVRTQFGD